MSTAAITDRPAPPASPLVDDLERELKFVLPATRVDIAARLLAMLAKPDTQYPDADVWTIYYDSHGFDSLDEKLNSDYLIWVTGPVQSMDGSIQRHSRL